jgi:hypothetical protein
VKARQAVYHGNQHEAGLPENLPEVPKGDSRDIAAKKHPRAQGRNLIGLHSGVSLGAFPTRGEETWSPQYRKQAALSEQLNIRLLSSGRFIITRKTEISMTENPQQSVLNFKNSTTRESAFYHQMKPVRFWMK